MVMTRYIDAEGRYYWKNINNEPVEQDEIKTSVEAVVEQTKEVKKKRKR